MENSLNIDALLAQMRADTRRIRALAEEIDPEQARWKPDPETWSLLEVVNHLYDEERFDFRVRLQIVLSRTGAEWPPINPPAWVVERAYNTRDLTESLQDFLREREQSLTWAASLKDADWEISATAPWGKEMRAGDLFASWVAHDLLHLRQLVELHWAWVNRQAGVYQTGYAGDW
jgi:hypothetical protein